MFYKQLQKYETVESVEAYNSQKLFHEKWKKKNFLKYQQCRGHDNQKNACETSGEYNKKT
jgi:hypothetical protein